jgi:hypothetical protein
MAATHTNLKKKKEPAVAAVNLKEQLMHLKIAR